MRGKFIDRSGYQKAVKESLGPRLEKSIHSERRRSIENTTRRRKEGEKASRITRLYEDSFPGSEVGIILGKGPSLQGFMENVRPEQLKDATVFGINEAGLLEMNGECISDYVVYIDKVGNWAPYDLDRVKVLRPHFFDNDHYGNGYYWYHSVDMPYGWGLKTSTACVHIAASMGIRNLMMVGFDGYDSQENQGYAPCVDVVKDPSSMRKRLLGDNQDMTLKSYHSIAEILQEVLLVHNLNVLWIHRQDQAYHNMHLDHERPYPGMSEWFLQTQPPQYGYLSTSD